MKQSKGHILVVDDDKTHRNMLLTLLQKWGFTLSDADDGSTAIELVKDQAYDLILMDIRMINVSGIEALDIIKAHNPAIPVIIMTAYSSIDTAIDAIKKGAYDYLTKPFDFDNLKLVIERALEHTYLKKENLILKSNLGQNFNRENIIGTSPQMERLVQTISQVAPTDASVLINGESGTGKELIANAIHHNSPRKDKPFIKVNCGAITETLLESELFGHEKGAFTGANRIKDGRFQQAHNGTLFLDEIGETSPSMQVKLLRALQEKEITRVGGENVIQVNVRIIAATNKNLMELIKANEFREDLYYRLNVINITVPSLKERVGDIPLLTQHFLSIYSQKNNKEISGFTPQAMNELVNYNWPGNVRELMNAIERCVILTQTDYIDLNILQLNPHLITSGLPDAHPSKHEKKDESLYEAEKKIILEMLEKAGGNKSETARRLGIARRTLHLKLKDYGVMS